MALRFKPGVDLRGVRPETVAAMHVVDGVYGDIGADDTTITSVKDGKHMERSLHYQGLAFDLRLPARSGSSAAGGEAARLIRERLGGQYDVVLEQTHIHVEFDPD